MVTLKGIAYRSGHIEFGREDNEWAFKRIDSEMRSGQEDRIRMCPSLAPVELRAYSEAEEHQLPWLEQFQRTIQSAESIYLQKHDGYLRFRKAIHPAGGNRRYITLSGQEEVDSFAAENWSKLRYLFATRRNIIRFDICRLISWKPSDDRTTRPLEIKSRMEVDDDSEPAIAFDASGPNTAVEIVDWRSDIKEGEKRKLFPDEHHIQLLLTQVNQPFSFLQELREEFNNYSYSFLDEKLRKSFDVLIKKRLQTIESQEET